MKESCICNCRIAKIGGKYFVNLRGPDGNNISTMISKAQTTRLSKELKLPIKDYDSEFNGQGQQGSEHQAHRDSTNI